MAHVLRYPTKVYAEDGVTIIDGTATARVLSTRISYARVEDGMPTGLPSVNALNDKGRVMSVSVYSRATCETHGESCELLAALDTPNAHLALRLAGWE
jgi:hypothetical protein